MTKACIYQFLVELLELAIISVCRQEVCNNTPRRLCNQDSPRCSSWTRRNTATVSRSWPTFTELQARLIHGCGPASARETWVFSYGKSHHITETWSLDRPSDAEVTCFCLCHGCFPVNTLDSGSPWVLQPSAIMARGPHYRNFPSSPLWERTYDSLGYCDLE